jgi:hypothetical protein
MGNKHHRKGYPYLWERGDTVQGCMKTRTIIRLPNSTFLDIEMISKGLLDKAKPFVKRGRKAAGLLKEDGRATEG